MGFLHRHFQFKLENRNIILTVYDRAHRMQNRWDRIHNELEILFDNLCGRAHGRQTKYDVPNHELEISCDNSYFNKSIRARL